MPFRRAVAEQPFISVNCAALPAEHSSSTASISCRLHGINEMLTCSRGSLAWRVTSWAKRLIRRRNNDQHRVANRIRPGYTSTIATGWADAFRKPI